MRTTSKVHRSESTYKDTGTALSSRALTAETLDLAVGVDLVVLEDRHLDLLALVLDLLGGAVLLFLALLGTTTQAEDEVEGRLLLDVVVREGAAVLELLACEDQALLVGGNADCNVVNDDVCGRECSATHPSLS